MRLSLINLYLVLAKIDQNVRKNIAKVQTDVKM